MPTSIRYLPRFNVSSLLMLNLHVLYVVSMRQKFSVRPIFSVPLRHLICIILVVGVGLFTVIAHHLISQRVAERRDVALAQTTDALVRELSQRMESYGDLLYATRGLFATSPVSRSSWEQFLTAQYVFDRYDGMKVIAYAEIVPEPKKDTYTTRLQQELQNPAFSIYPASQPREHAIVTYLQEDPSSSEYSAAPGYDLMTDPTRRAALEQARLRGHITATAPVALVKSEKPGFLLVLPLATTSGTEAYSIGAFDMTTLINKTIGQKLQQNSISLTISDITEPINKPLYRKHLYIDGATATHIVTMDVADRKWQLSFQIPENQLVNGTDRYAAAAVLVVGIILILLLALVIYSLRASRQLKCLVLR